MIVFIYNYVSTFSYNYYFYVNYSIYHTSSSIISKIALYSTLSTWMKTAWFDLSYLSVFFLSLFVVKYGYIMKICTTKIYYLIHYYYAKKTASSQHPGQEIKHCQYLWSPLHLPPHIPSCLSPPYSLVSSLWHLPWQLGLNKWSGNAWSMDKQMAREMLPKDTSAEFIIFTGEQVWTLEPCSMVGQNSLHMWKRHVPLSRVFKQHLLPWWLRW